MHPAPCAILLLDPRAAILPLLTAVLCDPAYTVTLVASEQAALALFYEAQRRQQAFTVVVTDGQAGAALMHAAQQQIPPAAVLVSAAVPSVTLAFDLLESTIFGYFAPAMSPAAVHACVARAAMYGTHTTTQLATAPSSHGWTAVVQAQSYDDPLRRATRQSMAGEQLLRRQEALIARLAAQHHETTSAQRLLIQLQCAQVALHTACQLVHAVRCYG